MSFIIDPIVNVLTKPGPLKPPPVGFEVTIDGNNYVAKCPAEFGVDPGNASTALANEDRRCYKPIEAREPGVAADDVTCPPGTYSDGRKCYNKCQDGYEEVVIEDPSGQGVLVQCKGACEQLWHTVKWGDRNNDGTDVQLKDTNICFRKGLPAGFNNSNQDTPSGLGNILKSNYDKECKGLEKSDGTCEGYVLPVPGYWAPRKSHDLSLAFIPGKCVPPNELLKDGSCVKDCPPGMKPDPENRAYCFEPSVTCKNHPDLFVNPNKDDLSYCKAKILPGKRSPSVLSFIGMAISGLIAGYLLIKLLTTKRK